MDFELRANHTATFGYDEDSANQIQDVVFELEVDTLDEAKEIVARFPKTCRLFATTVTYCYGSPRIVKGLVRGVIDLRANGSNKGVNETGIKRYQSFRRHAAKLGFGIDYKTPNGNSIPTEARFHEMIGI